MSDFEQRENEREVNIDLENLPSSLTYKLEDAEFTYSPLKFGIGERYTIEYYEQMFEKAFPGLLQQFPMLYYMVEEWRDQASQKTPLEHLEARK
jgi:hypothetical protein